MIPIMSELIRALFLAASSHALRQDAVLFHADDRVRTLFFVESGCVALERYLETGTATCLQRARAGQILAEASVYAEHYHCGARALEASVVKAVPVLEVRGRLHSNADLAEAWARHLARTVQTTRFLAEVRGLRTVSERLDAWLAEHGAIPAKGQWKTLAAELAVSQEALYRELAKRGLSNKACRDQLDSDIQLRPRGSVCASKGVRGRS